MYATGYMTCRGSCVDRFCQCNKYKAIGKGFCVLACGFIASPDYQQNLPLSHYASCSVLIVIVIYTTFYIPVSVKVSILTLEERELNTCHSSFETACAYLIEYFEGECQTS